MRSILQLGLMVLLLLGAGNRVWGKVAVGQTIAERGFVGSDVFVSVVDMPPVLMSSGALAASGCDSVAFEDGPNLYAYVEQNPWTAWDPDGLASESEKNWKAKRDEAASSGGELSKLYYGLRHAAAKLDPFNEDSSLREGMRNLGPRVEAGLEKIENSDAPRVFKSMAKFTVGTGMAGVSMEPMTLTAGLTETAQTVKQKGGMYVLKSMANSIGHDALNHPEKLIGGLMVGLATGKALAGDKLQFHTQGKEGSRMLAGTPGGTQLSFNAYMNNAKIAAGVPGVGFNILKEGKRVWGVELHRFNGKAGAGSMVRLHRHAGSTSSQISKHRHLFSDETY